MNTEGMIHQGLRSIIMEIFKFTKKAGALSVLKKEIEGITLKGTSGIAHTRWATHGAPTDNNAHPFLSFNSSVTVVHNGIIENYKALRQSLSEKGYAMESETDSEVIAHLIELFTVNNPHWTFNELVAYLAETLKGAYALLIQFVNKPNEIYGLRFECPLAYVQTPTTVAISSDIASLIGYDRNINILRDGQAVHLTLDTEDLINFDSSEVDCLHVNVDWDVKAAEKLGYDYFLRKEIAEQPTSVRGLKNTLMEKVNEIDEFITSVNPDAIIFIACGSASYSCVFATVFARNIELKQRVSWEIGSEFRYNPPIINEKTLVIGMSQSGETADTVSALRYAKLKGAKIISVINVVGSTISMIGDLTLNLSAGPEVAVPSTKAVINQFIAAVFLIEVLRQQKREALKQWLVSIEELEVGIEKIIEMEEDIKNYAKLLAGHQNMFVVGRGLDYPTSLEGALKLKETAYIHAEAMYAGEFKHGSISLIEYGMPVLILLGDESVAVKTVINAEEVATRGGQLLVIDSLDGECFDFSCDVSYIKIPPLKKPFNLIAQIVVLQLLAYHAGLHRNINVDKPRNLAKSVTVE
ncbi:MAG: glutamine--fructose-6-phosphate transaminase (isomerizing) [Methylococcales bacterium]|nr:glutamine--fructose-6-phosphate transaminase (isomerizing) [Methylococcales bacterium]